MYKKLFINILIILLILAGIIIIAGILWQVKNQFQDISQAPPNSQTSINDSAADTITPPPPPPVPEPAIVNSYEGTILKITENKITLATLFGEKTIEVNDDTLLQKVFKYKFPPIPGQTESREELPATENISWEDLTTGQVVEAVSQDNIKGQTEFLATEVNLLIKL